MSTMTTAAATTTRPTRAAKAGLVILGLLGLLDLLSATDTSGPAPAVILVLGAITGLVTLGALVPAWRTGNRAAIRAVVISRVVSILASVPVFFVDDLPTALVVASAGAVLLSVLGIYLVLRRPQA